jgi:hypothetical protein
LIHELSFPTAATDKAGPWATGLQAILRSSVTEMLFQGLSMTDQFEIIDTWVSQYKRAEEGRGPVSGEIWKIFEDTLTRSPFSLPAIYSSLKEENNPLTIKER